MAWPDVEVLSLAKVDEYGECLTKEAPFSNWKCSFLSPPAVSCDFSWDDGLETLGSEVTIANTIPMRLTRTFANQLLPKSSDPFGDEHAVYLLHTGIPT